MQMLIDISGRTYQIKYTKKKNKGYIIVSRKNKEIILSRVEEGWVTIHKEVKLEFKEDDIWELLDIFDFLFNFEKQLN